MIRAARASDAPAIAAIYNAGILRRSATFETRPREPDEILAWIARHARHPVCVAEGGGAVTGWARLAAYSDREAYAGVGECSVYVAEAQRGRGTGGRLLAALASEAEARGYWKLLGKLFPENAASARLVRAAGFREVGRHERHARLDGEWRDVVLVERLLAAAAVEPAAGRRSR